jgi:hypothetical protein
MGRSSAIALTVLLAAAGCIRGGAVGAGRGGQFVVTLIFDPAA